MGFIADIYNKEQTSPTTTDRYHFPTAFGYWLEGRAGNQAISYMFARKEFAGSGYTVAAGLEGCIDILKRWQDYGLSNEDIAFLRAQKGPEGVALYSDQFLDYMRNAEFKLKIDAAPEGSLIFPQEPLLRVEGPIEQVKIFESVALGIMNGHSAYATHATRLVDVIEAPMENGSPTGEASVQGLRRGPGLGAALEASRSLGLGGYTSTSTGKAAELFGQKFSGTMDHAWVMTHKHEIGDVPLRELFKMEQEGRLPELQNALVADAFRSYAFANPYGGVFLLDTYDPIQGLENAITVMKELRELGFPNNYGVRFDSGDIVAYSRRAMRRFAEECFLEGLTRADVDAMDNDELLKHSSKFNAFVAAADGIDEYSAKEMREAGCFITKWGIGTGGSHLPPLGEVYKSAAIYMDPLNGEPMPEGGKMTEVMKVASNAPAKSSNPGKINSRRYYDADGKLSHVTVYEENRGLDPDGKRANLHDFSKTAEGNAGLTFKDLLVPVFDEKGRYVYNEPPKKPSFPGSSYMVTDLEHIAKNIREELKTLPDNVRDVHRPREEVRKQKLDAAFKAAVAKGFTYLRVNMKKIEASLPPAVGHIPVFIDHNLVQLREEVMGRHLKNVQSGGVDEYTERFENKGGNDNQKKTRRKKSENTP